MPITTTPLPQAIKGIKYVLSDVDDTIPSNGQLLPKTYQAIHDLVAAGIIFIPITGGCAGWCDSFARLWPCAAVIGENGGLYIKKSPDQHLSYHFWHSESERSINSGKLRALAEHAIELIPQVSFAKDQAYRLVDVAIDYNQDNKDISAAQVAAILSVFHTAGARANASSIHVNAWFGDYNKKAMAQQLLKDEYQLTDQQMREQVLFIGDSLNDESMFEFFPNSVGVANITENLAALQHHPTWITKQTHGLGFIEMVHAVLAEWSITNLARYSCYV